jgi:hypothetical protein
MNGRRKDGGWVPENCRKWRDTGPVFPASGKGQDPANPFGREGRIKGSAAFEAGN